MEELLEQINSQDYSRYNNLDDYASGPWKTLKQFEKSLKNSTNGYILQYNKMKDFYERKIKDLQRKFSFREEALEEALLNTKLKCQQEVTRSEMEKEDILSQFNKFLTEGSFTNF